MKKLVSMLIIGIIALTLCACGKSEATKAAEDLILAVGTVSLNSESQILAAEEAVAVLTEEELEKLDNLEILQAARAEYDLLYAKKKATETDALIDAIGTVTMESGDAIAAARVAFDSIGEQAQGFVTKLQILENAENELGNMKAQVVIELIDAIGKVTLKNNDAVQTAKNAYDALSSIDQNRVTNAEVLKAAVASLKEMKLEDARKKLARLTVDEDFVRNINFYYAKGMPYYKQYGYWGADVRSFVLPYIGVSGDTAWLRLICNYTASDWVFFETIVFAVDDQRYYKTFDYFDVVRDNDWNSIWEYVDIVVDSEDLDLLRAIADSKKTIVRFQGDNYYDDFTVTASDKNAIKEMLEIYDAFN